MEPKCKCSTLKPYFQQGDTGAEALEQVRFLCREMRTMIVGGCWHADSRGLEQGDSTFYLPIFVSVKPDKPTQMSVFKRNVSLPMNW